MQCFSKTNKSRKRHGSLSRLAFIDLCLDPTPDAPRSYNPLTSWLLNKDTSNGVSLEISLSGILQALNHFSFGGHILHNCFSPSKEGVSVWDFRILKSSGHWPTGITTYLRHPLSECNHQPFIWKLIPFTSLDGSWVEQIIKTILMAHCQCVFVWLLY